MSHHPTIRIGYLKILDHLILGVTDHFLKTGGEPLSHSSLKIVEKNSWHLISQALTQDEIDAAFLPAPIAMDLAGKGLGIKILMLAHRGGSQIVKNKTAGITSIKNFKDKTVLVPSSLSIQAMLLHRLLSSSGLTMGDHSSPDTQVIAETIAPYLMAEMTKMDQDGNIAGFSVAEPFATLSLDQEIVTPVCSTTSLWKDHPCCVFAMKTSFIENHTHAIQEIVSVFMEKAKEIEDPDNQSTLDIAASFLDQEKSIIEDLLNNSGIRFTPSLLIPDEKSLGIIQTYMADTMNVLKNKVELSTFIDSSFIPDLALEKTIGD